MMDKLADSTLLKLYLNIQDSITPDTPEHEGSVSVKTPLVLLKSSVIAELFPDDGQVNKASITNTPSQEPANATISAEDPGVKVRNKPTNHDISLDSSEKKQ